VNVPNNFRDIRYAQDGNAYVGMIFYSAIGHSEYREYFSTKLLSELVKGKQYNVSYYVCYSSSSGIAISNMEALFSHDSIRQANESRIDKVPQLTYKGGILKDTVWTKISWVYTAKGDEQFLTIGNFTKSIECNKEMPDPRRKDYKVAYYFVDNVCVALMNADSSCNCEEPGIAGKHLSIEKNKNITLNNVFFESDKSELLPASFAELDELTAYLKKNSSNIEITGYTDNTGTQEKNLSLSEARAKAVADYLVSKGIKENRVKYKGFGSANPVTTNDTESGKAKNRRVEFKIASK
jgi:outer membrane protein OmpA-like peptidoglycan-associated protein